MRYLIVFSDGTLPFYTKWYDFENNFVQGMTVFNLSENTYSTNGKYFVEIPEDHL